MLIIPAIDLKDGKVVRLFQGRPSAQKVYSRNAAVIAKHWQKQGAQLIHVVDLDGALTGNIVNIGSLKEILKSVDIPVEFGGGVRDIITIKNLLKQGVSRVVLGTKAIEDKEFFKAAFEKFGDKVIVSIDVKDGKVTTNGWQKISTIGAIEFAYWLKEIGICKVIYTDITKDGTLRGCNFGGIKEFIEQTALKVIASGGVSSLNDIQQLCLICGVEAVIIGKALYENKFTLKEAVGLIKRKNNKHILSKEGR
ncbi:MAG: 1-(5-phosphoribosyl)-5-[(5-phosphoribosylamino)methylideneamino]imidazole-4-carboxamide isomerase [Candidatus Omnitrophica bacterium]|nr:1-(5-phosphoribosyl)-5-[(5-phosphoribosylamino)methylideneamino]imidazole-4-carboxamide isomerase [Candidatus Omnitrophota bacterium]